MKKIEIFLYFILSIILYFISTFNYLLFHTVIELFTIFVGIGMLVLASNNLTEKSKTNEPFYVFLGIMFGGISIIDLLHTLSYKGMAIIPHLTANQATQFWVIARFTESIVILASILFIEKVKKVNIKTLFVINIVLIAISIVSVHILPIFPDCYIEEQGITLFKKFSEYLIISLLIASLFILWKKKSLFQKDDYSNFRLIIIITILSEFMFTLYVSVYGIPNMLGHLFKFIAFILVYKSILQKLLISPYQKINTELMEANLKIKEELNETKSNYKEIVENIEDLIIIIDSKGEILYANHKTKPFFGEDSEACMGFSIFNFIHHDDIEKSTKELEKSIEDESVQNICFENRTINDTFLLWNAKKVINTDNKNISFFSIAKNITDIKKYQDEIKKEKEMAEIANKAKSQFLSNMSHEIRTPLNGIIGFCDLLHEVEKDQEKLEMLNCVISSGELLLGIINDVLDLAKIETGKYILDQGEINIKELIENISDVYIKTNTNRVYFKYEIDSKIDFNIIGDKIRLNQILMNLLSNSKKFTEKGMIKLKLTLEDIEHEEEKLLIFSIKDTGIGVKSENVDLIFEKFTQENMTINKKYGGTGLGLAIVKDLVKIMNGEIYVNTEYKNGAEFIVKIPFKIVRKELEKEKIKNNSLNLKENLKILVVEDNVSNQMVIKKMLKENDNIVLDIANNGETALEKIATLNYDIVLMDIQLPDMNGIEVTKEIRRRGIDVKIIAVSAYVFEEEIKKIMESGANSFLPKPFKKHELLSIITNT